MKSLMPKVNQILGLGSEYEGEVGKVAVGKFTHKFTYRDEPSRKKQKKNISIYLYPHLCWPNSTKNKLNQQNGPQPPRSGHTIPITSFTLEFSKWYSTVHLTEQRQIFVRTHSTLSIKIKVNNKIRRMAWQNLSLFGGCVKWPDCWAHKSHLKRSPPCQLLWIRVRLSHKSTHTPENPPKKALPTGTVEHPKLTVWPQNVPQSLFFFLLSRINLKDDTDIRRE